MASSFRPFGEKLLLEAALHVFQGDVATLKELENQGTKRGVVSVLVEKKSKKDELLAHLDILHLMLPATKKSWQSLKMVNFGGSEQRLVQPHARSSRLSLFLQPFFAQYHVYAALLDELLWIRIAIGASGSAANSVVLLVHQPHTPFFLVSSLRPAYRDVVLVGLAHAFDCEKVEFGALSGKRVQSLMDMLANASSQGPASHFVLNQVDQNPLDRKRKRVPVRSAVDEAGIVSEDLEEQESRSKQQRKQFGDNPLPVLEKVQFEIVKSLQGNGDAQLTASVGLFPCKVVLEGRNVLEGLRLLIPQAMTSGYLAGFVANIPSSSANSFRITDDAAEPASLSTSKAKKKIA